MVGIEKRNAVATKPAMTAVEGAKQARTKMKQADATAPNRKERKSRASIQALVPIVCPVVYIVKSCREGVAFETVRRANLLDVPSTQ